MDEKEILMTPQQAAEYLGVNYRVILRWISDGQLSCYRIGDGRSIRIGINHIREYLKDHEVCKETVNESERIETPA